MDYNEIKHLRTEIARREAELAQLKDRLTEVEKSVHHTDALSSDLHNGVAEDTHKDLQWRWPLAADEYKRYGRQMILPEVSLQGRILSKTAEYLC